MTRASRPRLVVREVRSRLVAFGCGIAIAAAVLVSCQSAQQASAVVAPHPVQLNSERIEHRFGSYGVEVLESSEQLRVSNLYSLDGETKICRTLAVVHFPPNPDPRIAAEHQLILAGGSIGAVFKRRGWTITKEILLIAEIPQSQPHERVARLMNLAGDPKPLALLAYSFVVTRDNAKIPYATIAEVYHPDYLSRSDLAESYSSDVVAGTEDNPRLAELLAAVTQAADSCGTGCVAMPVEVSN